MSSAIDDLAATPPTEFGGPNASTGFEYQRHWTVCLLIELHKSEGDYLVVCDYHDDVLVLEGGVAAEKIDFYQVKTTSRRPWTVNRLIKQEKSKSGELLPSVLGKLFQHKQTFKSRTNKLAVVCNLPYSIDLSEDAKVTAEEITFTALSDADRNTIVEGIKRELSLTDSPAIDVSLVFMVSSLNLTDHENGTRGRLEELLRKKFPTREQFPVHPIYKVLLDEVVRLSKYNEPCRHVSDLIALKGFQRKQLEEYIVSCIKEADRRNPHRLSGQVMEELRADGLRYLQRKRVVDALDLYCLERLDPTRADLAKLSSMASSYLKADPSGDKFVDILRGGTIALRRNREASSFSDDYLMAIVAWEVLTNGWELPATTSQSKEEDQ